jgi:hypothetical protein
MDNWMLDQTKAAFMGITGHWVDIQASTWIIRSEVITFRGLSGSHDGQSLGNYFVWLCERVGIFSGNNSKLFCTTADNASSNNTTCQRVEQVLNRRGITSFNPLEQRLPCVFLLI